MKISYGIYTEILNEVTTIPYMSEKLNHFLNTCYQLSTREVSDEDTVFQDSRYFQFNPKELVYMRIEFLCFSGIEFRLIHTKNNKYVNIFSCGRMDKEMHYSNSMIYTKYDDWFSYCFFDWNELFKYLDLLLLRII